MYDSNLQKRLANIALNLAVRLGRNVPIPRQDRKGITNHFRLGFRYIATPRGTVEIEDQNK
jgi:hypothetical protein